MQTSEITTKSENLRITQQHPEILTHPEVLEALLVPLQTWCLKTQLLENRPFSTGELHGRVIIDIWISSLRKWPEGTLRTLIGEEVAKIHSPYGVYPGGSGKFALLQIPTPKEIKEIRKELQSNGIKYPSYEKIDDMMQSLESWGFVTRLHESTGKVKHFWVLQPAFLLNYAPNIREYLKKREVNLTW